MKFLKAFDIKKGVSINFWLKIISLVVAILVWFYVSAIITGGGRSV